MPYPWHCALSIVRHVSSVSTITTRNNEAYQIHILCKCLSCSWIVPPRDWWRPLTSVIKLWLKNHIFIFSTSSLKQPAGGTSYYARRLLKLKPLKFVHIMVKLYLQAFWQNFECGKMQKFGFCLQDL